MVTVADTDTGVYILQDQGGWRAANTPNTCTLGGAGLTLGEGYIYFDDFLSLTTTTSTPNNSDFMGWNVGQRTGSTNRQKTGAICAQGIFKQFTLNVLVTSTQQQNFEKFFDFANDVSSSQYHLVRQWASTTFKQFSYEQTLYKYAYVILTGYSLSETNKEGKDIQNLQIQMTQAQLLSDL
jgi:hypothetical protein